MPSTNEIVVRSVEERRRVETVVKTLANLQGQGETLAAVAHDARNMVTALGLYCDLLEEPGVLAAPYMHYGSELRLVAAASRRLVEKLTALDNAEATQPSFWRGEAAAGAQWPARLPRLQTHQQEARWEAMPSEPVANLAAELLATRNLLAALAGPGTVVTVEAVGGALPVRMTGEDLTRVLVNLVKNAIEAMPSGGRIHLALSESASGDQDGAEGACPWLTLAIEDNGPGIPAQALEEIFVAGYSGHARDSSGKGDGMAAHRGLGLAIVRSVVEQAGGRIRAENRALGGARFVMELPAHP